jgi:hypothetical protein
VSTPQHILDRVLVCAERAIGCHPVQGRLVFVTDGFFSGGEAGGEWGAMLSPRESVIESLAKIPWPPETLEEIRNMPSCVVPVVWFIGDHAGACAYRPAWTGS